MFKRLLSALCCLMLLCSFALAEEPLVLTKTKDKEILRVEGEKRFVNDAAGIFTTDRMEKLVNAFNAAFDALPKGHPPIYLYLVESSRSHPIARTFDENSPAYNYLLENLHADYFDHLKYTTYEEFCNYFYTTDHHWNYKGSYQGYVDVVRLLLGPDEKVLEPVEEFTCKQIYNGSYAHTLKDPISDEHFTIYRYDPFPVYECYTSRTNYKKGKKSQYTHFNTYLENKAKNGRYANHYAQCYGGDAGFLLFKSEAPQDRVLLIIGNSLSNAVKTMLTAHFGTVVYIDPRKYPKKSFTISGLIEEFGATQVLLLGDANLFIFGEAPRP